MEATRKLLKVLREFNTLDNALSNQSMMALLYCALNENKPGGTSIKDVRDELGLSVSAGSRTVNNWTDAQRGKGKGLLILRPDPADARRINISLSTRGKSIISQIEALLE